MTKKTEVVTFRTDTDTKKILEIAAKQNSWSVAQTVETICKNFTVNPQPGKIIIYRKELDRISKELERDGCEAIEISIELYYDEEKEDVYRVIECKGLQCGGLGCILDYDFIKELTPQELDEIP